MRTRKQRYYPWWLSKRACWTRIVISLGILGTIWCVILGYMHLLQLERTTTANATHPKEHTASTRIRFSIMVCNIYNRLYPILHRWLEFGCTMWCSIHGTCYILMFVIFVLMGVGIHGRVMSFVLLLFLQCFIFYQMHTSLKNRIVGGRSTDGSIPMNHHHNHSYTSDTQKKSISSGSNSGSSSTTESYTRHKRNEYRIITFFKQLWSDEPEESLIHNDHDHGNINNNNNNNNNNNTTSHPKQLLDDPHHRIYPSVVTEPMTINSTLSNNSISSSSSSSVTMNQISFLTHYLLVITINGISRLTIYTSLPLIESIETFVLHIGMNILLFRELFNTVPRKPWYCLVCVTTFSAIMTLCVCGQAIFEFNVVWPIAIVWIWYYMQNKWGSGKIDWIGLSCASVVHRHRVGHPSTSSTNISSVASSSSTPTPTPTPSTKRNSTHIHKQTNKHLEPIA